MIDDKNELFVVVDEKDNIIEYRTRYDCHHDKRLIHRAVGVIIYNDQNKILLQKRSQQKDTYPGFYTVSASGHVTKGQSYEEAILREMQEELGIETEVSFIKKFVCKMPNETEMDVLFTAKHNGPFTIAEDEVEKVEFFDKEEVKKMKERMGPFTKKCLEIVEII